MLERVARGRGHKYELLANFAPVTLRWTSSGNRLQKPFYPEREIYCDFITVRSPDHKFGLTYVGATEEDKASNNAFIAADIPFAQPEYLTPGSYKLDVAVYCVNARKVNKQFSLTWSGNWRDNEG